jgi:phage terminase small subunit
MAMGRKDENGLTPKQEKFCQEYIATGNASEAYRRSYNTERYTPKSINENASRLLAEAKVLSRVNKLRADIAARHELTVDDIIAELDEARVISKEDRNGSVMVSASMSKAKLLGMVTEKKDVTIHQVFEQMEDDALDEFIAERLSDEAY